MCLNGLQRNTIMFSNQIVFNNSLFIQTGLTFNYFTKFFADYYNPLLSEFVTQNYKEIGDYPKNGFSFLMLKFSKQECF